MGLFGRARAAYTKNPLPANTLLGYSVFALGDSMAQLFVEDSDTWNARRSLSIGFLGALQNGVIMHAWYRILDRVVSPKTDPFTVVRKICCDEAVFAPQLACSYLAASAYISRPGDWALVSANVRGKALETWSNDAKLWPVANFIGFSFIPIHVRPAYASAVQLVWQTYLSSVGFRQHHPVGEHHADAVAAELAQGASAAEAEAAAAAADLAEQHDVLARKLASWLKNFHDLFELH